MALGTITRTYTARLALDILAAFATSGDSAGGVELPRDWRKSITFADGAGATDPNISGWLYQSGLQYSAGTDLFSAHATDPFQGAGNAVYSDVAFSPAGKKIKLIAVEAPSTNTANVQFGRGASQGYTGFLAASDAVVLSPGGIFLLYDPGGDVGGALTTATNDRFLIQPASGTQELNAVFIYGT